MSLVAYDSSDESSEEEANEFAANGKDEAEHKTVVEQANGKLCLPTPRHSENNSVTEESSNVEESTEKIHFEKLPKPKAVEQVNIIEEDDIPPKKESESSQPEKPTKKDRAPVRITVPSLSEFKDLDEENERKRNKIMPSQKGTGLFALLPPPKMGETKGSKALVPQVVAKASGNVNQTKVQPVKKAQTENSGLGKAGKPAALKKSLLASYDSNSEDEDDTSINGNSQGTTDFFALSETKSISSTHVPELPLSDKTKLSTSKIDSIAKDNLHKESIEHKDAVESSDVNTEEYTQNKTLVSNIMNLSREEILLKNKAEVGPKLPVPEQEYNIDTEGNVAFDEKAIEYLCGRRGVKRKNKEIDEANIIEINGEDIKPDEREWLVKALTEEPVQRPVSMQGGGVNSTSKKKHQITYLAHQAKAMEMELKNQWAQNRMTRKQTQSKYGF